MKNHVSVLAGLLLAGALATAASAQTKWDMPTPYPDGNFHTKNVIQFTKDVEKATSGSLTIAGAFGWLPDQACGDQALGPPGHDADRRNARVAFLQ